MKINFIDNDVEPIQNYFTTKNNQGNMSLLKYLRCMYWIGFLPFEWIDSESQAFNNIKFRVSGCKTLLILLTDLLLVSLVFVYFPIWHWLNFGNEFDLKLLLDQDYYRAVFVTTTSAFCNLQFLTFPALTFWIFVVMGKFYYQIMPKRFSQYVISRMLFEVKILSGRLQ